MREATALEDGDSSLFSSRPLQSPSGLVLRFSDGPPSPSHNVLPFVGSSLSIFLFNQIVSGEDPYDTVHRGSTWPPGETPTQGPQDR